MSRLRFDEEVRRGQSQGPSAGPCLDIYPTNAVRMLDCRVRNAWFVGSNPRASIFFPFADRCCHKHACPVSQTPVS